MPQYSFTKPIKIQSFSHNSHKDCLVLPVSKSIFDTFLSGGTLHTHGLLTDDDCDVIEKVAKQKDFTAKCGQTLFVPALPKSSFASVVLYGIGSPSECNKNIELKLPGYESKGGKICDILASENVVSATVYAGNIDTYSADEIDKISLSISYGIVQKLYRFTKHITVQKKLEALPKLTHINIISGSDINHCIEHKNILLNSIYMVRDLCNEPANIIYPEKYALIVKEEASKLDNVEVDILELKDLQKLGMNALLGVAIGSEKEPRVVIIKYHGNDEKEGYDLALVGKGVTFDSGGLSLKPADSMEDMKDDMAGSAVAFASIQALAQRKAKVNVIAALGLVENMVNGRAQKPGDIVKSMSGQTIEVLNTDAEGRLVLADVLYYVKTHYNPSNIIDFATLTGAIVVALGFEYAGLFSNSDCLSEDILSAAQKSGEKCWRMPLDEAYNKLMDSPIADVKNISGGRGAGSITAAQFMQRFIDGHTRWAHIDIAGVGGLLKTDGALFKAGASGFGVKLVDKYVKECVESCSKKNGCHDKISSCNIDKA